MKRTLASERGVAMLAALGAIILIGIIMAGVLFSVTQDSRISDNSMRQSRATRLPRACLERRAALSSPVGDMVYCFASICRR